MRLLKYLRLILTVILVLICIIFVNAQNVLIIWDVNSIDTKNLKAALESEGMIVTISDAPEHQYNGNNPSPNGFHAIIHLNGLTWNQDMPIAGQDSIVQFVNNGGVFVHTEWDSYEIKYNQLVNMRDLILFDRLSGYQGSVTFSILPAYVNHPILSGIPASFTVNCGVNRGNIHNFQENPAEVLVKDHMNNDAVAIRSFGEGDVIGFNHAGNFTVNVLSNTVIQQLFINAIKWGVSNDCDLSISSATVNHLICYNQPTGNIDITVSDGTPPYTYNWSNGATTEDISGLSAGKYYVTVTDTFGCQANDSAVLIEPDPLTTLIVVSSDYNGSDISCYGEADGALDLTVSGGTGSYEYNWSNSEITEDIEGLEAGIYYVTIADANGCQVIDSAELTQPDPMSTLVVVSSDYNGSDISCYGEADGALDLTISGGTGSYEYNWSNSETTEDIEGLEAGIYYVTVADTNGCQAIDSAELTQPDPLSTLIVVSSDYNGSNISCYGESDGALDLTISGGTGSYEYIWSNGAVTEDIEELEAGQYYVTISDINGCQAIDSAELTQPDPMSTHVVISSDYNGSDISCYGEADGALDLTVSGGTGSYEYNWSNGEVTEDIGDLEAGKYFVTVADTNGCQAIDSAELVQPDPIIAIIEVTSDYNGQAVSCYGANDGSIDLTVSGGTEPYAYSWSNGATTEDLINIGAGTYSVTISDANNCQLNTGLTVIITEPDPLVVDLGENQFILYGYPETECTLIEPSISGGVPDYSIQWNTGITDSIIEVCPDTTEVFKAIVTDANNCTASDSIKICVVDIQCEKGKCRKSCGKKKKHCHRSRHGETKCNRSGCSSHECGKLKCGGTKPPKCQPKVLLCHTIKTKKGIKRKTKCVSLAAVPALISKPEYTLGPCDMDCKVCEFDTAGVKTAKVDNLENKVYANNIYLDLMPNPAKYAFTVDYRLDTGDFIIIKIYTLTGMEISSLYKGWAEKGENYSIELSSEQFSSGIYLIKLITEHNGILVKKIIIQK